MKARLLIVDDEEQFVEAISERLSMRDYDVTTSLTGEDAIEKITNYNFDVVILDVRLPGIDGTEVLQEMKNLAAALAAALTANPEREEVVLRLSKKKERT